MAMRNRCLAVPGGSTCHDSLQVHASLAVLLTGADKVQAKVAAKKVDAEYDRWHAPAIAAPSPVEQHFVEAIAKVKQIQAVKPKSARNGKGECA